MTGPEPADQEQALEPGSYIPTLGDGAWSICPRCYPTVPTDSDRLDGGWPPATYWRAPMSVVTRDGVRVVGGIAVCYVCGWSPYTEAPPATPPTGLRPEADGPMQGDGRG